MMNKIKNIVKKRPLLYSLVKRVRSLIKSINIKTLAANFQYHKAKLLKQPYFGKKYGANMMTDEEAHVLRKIINHAVNRSSVICLEIGSWAGCSATIIAEILKQSEEREKGVLFCVDTWQGTPGALITKRIIKKGTIFNLFMHNIKYSGLEKYVIPIVASSDEFTKIAIERGDRYDLIFIDGDHRYAQVKKDITNCFKLLKVGGVICGDDLEFLSHQTDEAFTKENCDKDFAVDPEGRAYHPGVTLAIKEIFDNNVGLKHSIWSIQKTDKGWIPFNI